MDTEVEVVEVGADSPLVHNTGGWSDRLVYVRQCLCGIFYSCLWILFLEAHPLVLFPIDKSIG